MLNEVSGHCNVLKFSMKNSVRNSSKDYLFQRLFKHDSSDFVKDLFKKHDLESQTLLENDCASISYQFLLIF